MLTWLFLKLVPKEPADRYERITMTKCTKCYQGSIEKEEEIQVLNDENEYQTVTTYWEWHTCPCCRGNYENCPNCAAEIGIYKKDYGWD